MARKSKKTTTSNEEVKEVKEDEEKKEIIQKPCAYCKIKIAIDVEDIIKRGSLTFHKGCWQLYQEDTEKVQLKTKERKCKLCGEMVDPLSPDAIDVSINTYHVACHEKFERQKANMYELYDYICLKYNIEFLTGYMLKQVNEYHKKRGYSYKAILTTLKYAFEVEKKTAIENAGLGLIPFYYEKAKQYYSKIQAAGDSAENAHISNVPIKVKAINPKVQKKIGYIDMNDM